jgi:homogentisate phytyltransferase/homogentisate geranylgeranyltransferase
MTKLVLLYGRMVRYRVAAMIWMFMLLGAAHQGILNGPSVRLLWATLALASSYVAATTVNDVADEEIDRVNHPIDRGRPLVTGEASRRDLLRLHLVAVGLALASGAMVGRSGFLLVVASLAIGEVYSLPPVRLSYRTYLAPVALSVAYVLIPYGLGVTVAGGRLERADGWFAGSLLMLFLARISLKDFRDREGDARFGRPTLLLRFGKTTTCLASLGALAAGNVMLLSSLQLPLAIGVIVELFVGTVASRLFVLWRAVDEREEQVAIGIGARMGNGLLITVLAWLALRAHGAPLQDQILVSAAVASLFALGFWALVSRPEEALIGYKG